MSDLLPFLFVLACPVAMGGMMFVMMRGRSDTGASAQGNARGTEQTSEGRPPS